MNASKAKAMALIINAMRCGFRMHAQTE